MKRNADEVPGIGKDIRWKLKILASIMDPDVLVRVQHLGTPGSIVEHVGLLPGTINALHLEALRQLESISPPLGNRCMGCANGVNDL